MGKPFFKASNDGPFETLRESDEVTQGDFQQGVGDESAT
jgi:hypothetical protein